MFPPYSIFIFYFIALNCVYVHARVCVCLLVGVMYITRNIMGREMVLPEK